MGQHGGEKQWEFRYTMKVGFASGLNVGYGKNTGIKDDSQIWGLSYYWDNELGKWNL